MRSVLVLSRCDEIGHGRILAKRWRGSHLLRPNEFKFSC